MKIVRNLWGWDPKGVWYWLRFSWAWPLETWGVEIPGSNPTRFARYCKIGPFCFRLGIYCTLD